MADKPNQPTQSEPHNPSPNPPEPKPVPATGRVKRFFKSVGRSIGIAIGEAKFDQ